MKNFFIYIPFFIGMSAYGQKPIEINPIEAVYKILSNESINVKDSLAIYALNFELSISKKNKGTIVTKIAANDSLAFIIFPSYKKLSSIDFSSLMGTRSKVRVVVPILIYGSSPEKMLHQDKHGNPLIDMNAAVNAAYALYRPFKYDNIKDAKEPLGHIMWRDSGNEESKSSYWDVITFNPLIRVIYNIK